MKIPITKVYFDERELLAVQKPLKSGWIVQGPFVKAFEDKFAKFTGAKYAIACTSCTTALHIALVALGVGPSDEVIVPAFTWIATANAVEYVGAKVVFCDIDLETYNIDVKQIESKITSKTKAIIPVHLFGLPAEIRSIMQIGRKYNLFVVEDAACGFGSYYKGRHVGTFGNFGCFSFHPRKAVTTGEGGMILTNTLRHETLCRSLRDHGASKSDLTRHKSKTPFNLAEYNVRGYNYRMTDIQGAIGVAQMKKAKWIQHQRTARAKRYDELLKDIDWLKSPGVPKNYIHGYQSYVCLFQPEEPSVKNLEKLHKHRNRILLDLEKFGIQARQGTHAVHIQQYYEHKYKLKDKDFINALIADHLTITLPLYAQMKDEEQDYVVEILQKVI